MFGNYLKSSSPRHTEIYELKITKHGSLPFDHLAKHQEESLINANDDGFYHKISDPPIFYGQNSRFNLPRPFDCLYLVKVPAFVVLWFYKPRQPKVFYKIPIHDFINERETCGRKSLREERAMKIGKALYIHGK